MQPAQKSPSQATLVHWQHIYESYALGETLVEDTKNLNLSEFICQTKSIWIDLHCQTEWTIIDLARLAFADYQWITKLVNFINLSSQFNFLFCFHFCSFACISLVLRKELETQDHASTHFCTELIQPLPNYRL